MLKQGDKVGYLTLLEDQTSCRVRCLCNCGKEYVARADKLRTRDNPSCGCMRAPDLIGQKFGSLTVVCKDHVGKDRGVIWKCQCDCGETRLYTTRVLKNGKFTMCGRCSSLERHPQGQVPQRSLYNSYKSGANHRKLVFRLSMGVFLHLTSQPCYYCGALPAQIAVNRLDSTDHYTYNGIDRMDSSKGYIEGNIVSCCFQCNYGKRQLSPEEYIEHCQKVVDYRKGSK